jgi:hypothetical protein
MDEQIKRGIKPNSSNKPETEKEKKERNQKEQKQNSQNAIINGGVDQNNSDLDSRDVNKGGQ